MIAAAVDSGLQIGAEVRMPVSRTKVTMLEAVPRRTMPVVRATLPPTTPYFTKAPKLRPLVAPDEVVGPGTVIAGRYIVVDQIGSGGLASVYLALHRVTCRPVALKVTRPRGQDGSEILLRFLRESQCASALRHPAIVDIYDAGVTDSGVAFIAMELVDGKTLRACLAADDGPVGLEALRLGRAIAEAVSHAHAFNVIHRDLKPENVMLVGGTGDRQLKLVDFGLAAPVKYADADRVTTAGTVAGTPLYMSPEQAKGLPATPAFDVYSLGLLLYELMAHAPLRERGTAGETATAEVAIVRARDELADRVVPGGYAELVAACLCVDPRGRPTATEVAQRLAQMSETGWVRKRRILRWIGSSVWHRTMFSAFFAASSLAFAVALLGAAEPADALASFLRTSSIASVASAPPRDATDAMSPTSGPESIDCEDEYVRLSVERAGHQWQDIVDRIDAGACLSRAEQIRWQTKARLELGDLETCVRVGAASQDAEVQQRVALCRERIERARTDAP